MYVRSKVAKGHKYFQIVEGKRDGDQVRQTLVVALGTTDDPAKALTEMKVELARIRGERKRYPTDTTTLGKVKTVEAQRLDRMAAAIESRVKILDSIIRNGALARAD